MKKYNIVVARYNEDLSWISKLDKKKYNVIIYNKGQDDVSYPCIKMENMGRDAESFVRYIVTNYDNLPEYVAFVQGNPFAHCPEFMKKLATHDSESFFPLTEFFCLESVFGWYETLQKRPEQFPITYLHTTSADILKYEAPKEVLVFGAGQQYIVHKNIIKRRDIDFYKYILDKFPTEFLLPWHIERLWLSIWKIGYAMKEPQSIGIIKQDIEWQNTI
jgi:hypothetical protein